MAEIVVTPDEMRRAEEYIINTQRVPSLLLMDCAGGFVCGRFQGKSALVICGAGNNGGDGYSAARHLLMNGKRAEVWAIGAFPAKGDAKTCFEAFTGSGGKARLITDALALENADVSGFDGIIDAIFGIGLNRPVEGLNAAAVEFINKSCLPVLSVDAPSGADCETGKILGTAVRANETVTFQYKKKGQLFYPARELCGRLTVAPIAAMNDYKASSRLLTNGDDVQLLKKRAPDAHKGDFGKALLIAGSAGMAGAAIIAARAALRTGAGLLSLAVPRSIAPSVWAALPEAMAHGVDSAEELKTLLEGKTCAAIGPGLGKSERVCAWLETALESGLPLVIDADGLNALSRDVSRLKNAKNVLLTPHIGEMARLTGKSIEEISNDAETAALELSNKTGAVVLLKGAATVIASPEGKTALNITGGSMLAKGGSGDILTGIALGLISQGLAVFDAARLAAYILGRAAELVNKPENSVIASDVVEAIPECF